MKFLFIGGLLPSNNIDEIINNSKKNIDFAAHNFQKKILNGLSENKINYDVISVPFISSFPKYYKKIIIKGKQLENIKYLQFINLPFYKVISRYNTLKKALKYYFKNADIECNVIIYSLHYPFLKNAKKIKKYNPNCKINLIVPDLQEYMSNRTNYLFSILKKIEIKKTNKYLKYIDSFVFLTQHMNDKLNKENKPYTIIEGITDYNIDYKYEDIDSSSQKYLIYTGTLVERYGVMNLINAFLKIKNQNIKLIICGQGEKADEIRNIAKKNNRIIFKGLMSPQDVRNMQNNAFALINPRPNNEEYTKYSFPSKIMEYISTGKPVICYKLDGFPKEYDDVLIYPDGDTIEDLAICIDKVFNYDIEKLENIKKRSQYLVINKNSKKSVEKILNLFYDQGK